ncbi:DUF1972 domain-containing protein [Tessaracoccus coleopterorum]|uniref:DUF1972 domain-containing protein n=1 Tax=Tessaracoccus coleopterorum TaxID=2714950 RepID=UPI0018D3DA7B|nr:DUF1972 domain-containing protein [Tessaracoccus coleopterorum]
MTTEHPVAARPDPGVADSRPTVRILGTHGVPANYGGFETAAEKVGLHLLERGWRVVIYCQVPGRGPITYDVWRGIERVNVAVDLPGWRGTSLFDLICVRHAGRHRDVNLVFGYNTGIFNIWQRLRRIPMVINMDGIEWSRSRWGFTRQAILYINERFAALFGNHLIADHPEIEKYLWSRAPRRKITMIAYGADEVLEADEAPVRALGLEPGGYLTLICRPIPENSILEIVEGSPAGHAATVWRCSVTTARRRTATTGRWWRPPRTRSSSSAPSSTPTWCSRCGSTARCICTVTRSGAPTRPWWRRSGLVIPCSPTTTPTTGGQPDPIRRSSQRPMT